MAGSAKWYVRAERACIPYIAADFDASTVTRDRRDGHDVFYGDAADSEVPRDLRPGRLPPESSSPSIRTS
jgi:hypothetical protein